jgi:hypothetical protein
MAYRDLTAALERRVCEARGVIVVGSALAGCVATSCRPFTEGAPPDADAAAVGMADSGGALVAMVDSGAAVLVGTNTVALSDDLVADGTAGVCPFTAIASGTAHRIAIFSGLGTVPLRVNLGIYADSRGAASTLLAQATLTNIRQGEWNFVTLPAVSILQGTPYWIGLNPVGADLKIRDKDGTNEATTVYADPATGISSLPTDWLNGPSYRSGPWSAYVAE